MRTIPPDKFARLMRDLEETYGPHPVNVWEAALLIWRRAESLRRDADGEVRNAMPALLVAARSETRPAPRYEGRQPATARREIAGGDRSEREHARLISERIGLIGNTDPDVQEFRASLWGNPGPLAPEVARRFLESPLLRHATKEELNAWGIPAAGHTATIVARERTAQHETERVEVVWQHSGEERGQRRHTVQYGWLPRPEQDQHYLEFPSEEGGITGVRVSPVSVLGMLRQQAEDLSDRPPYEVWHSAGGLPPVAAATWFLVSGQAPVLSPISASWSVPGSVDLITITALARVASLDSIRDAYANAYEKAMRVRKRRPFDPRTLRLVHFVEERMGGPVQDLSDTQARELWTEWNQKHSTIRKGKFSWPRDLRDTYSRGTRAFFPDPRMSAREALARGELSYELGALAVLYREISRRTGQPLSSSELARKLLDAMGPRPEGPLTAERHTRER